ncbi:hypothetical protein QYF36_027294 [Acer negundo]|nr:hypothetical protein QYF36_027294 [Acer negundo]
MHLRMNLSSPLLLVLVLMILFLSTKNITCSSSQMILINGFRNGSMNQAMDLLLDSHTITNRMLFDFGNVVTHNFDKQKKPIVDGCGRKPYGRCLGDQNNPKVQENCLGIYNRLC